MFSRLLQLYLLLTHEVHRNVGRWLARGSGYGLCGSLAPLLHRVTRMIEVKMMPSINKISQILQCLSSKRKKNTHSSVIIMATVKDLKVLHGSGDEVVEQKLFFLLSCITAVLSESPLSPLVKTHLVFTMEPVSPVKPLIPGALMQIW